VEFRFHRAIRAHLPMRAELSDASSGYLMYSAFGGDLEITDGESSIRTNVGWVPWLNLLLELPRAVGSSIADGVGIYHFTESDSLLKFTSKLDKSCISGSFTDEKITVDQAELLTALGVFHRNSLARIMESNPELSDNVFFAASFINK
jgi:hypothetical protein